jgi:hypothetical protein
MAGSVIGSDQVNNVITSLAVNLRNIMQQISNLNKSVNGQAAGLAYLVSIGYSNTIATSSPNNPVINGTMITDAQYALNMIGYLNTVAAVYFGTAPQTPAFSFDEELSQVWAGQIG